MAVKDSSTIPKTYKGIYKYDLASGAVCQNPTVMLSADDTVMFCVDVTAGADGLIGTLPPDLRPVAPISVPAIVNGVPGMVEIRDTGEMTAYGLELSLSGSGSGSYNEETGHVSVSVSVSGYPYMSAAANATVELNGAVFSLVGNSYNWNDAQGTGGEDAG